MLAVSAAVAGDGHPSEVLDEISAQASFLMGVDGASILEFAGDRFRIVGSFGLSPEYRTRLAEWPTRLAPGRGPSGLAVRTRAPVLTSDVTEDERFVGFAELVRSEGHRAVASTPLIFAGEMLGTLTIYRKAPRRWEDADVRMLTFFAEHAATAIRTAHVLAEQQRQVAALERVVLRLREQAHEYANRIHALAGLLATNAVDEARSFINGLVRAQIDDGVVLQRQSARNPLAGLLWTEAMLARQRSIEFELDVTEDLDRLPLTDAQALTIVGNLLDNAMENVADVFGRRRRVCVRISMDPQRAVIDVEGGGSPPPTSDDLFARGYSTKDEHAGIGLALVQDAVQAARGQIEVERRADGAAFVVTVPMPAEAR